MINKKTKLRKSKYKFTLPSISSDILDRVPFGVYVVNREGIIEYFNPAMVEMAGAESPDEIVGLNVLTIPTYKKYGLVKYFKKGLKGKPFRVDALKYTSYTGHKTTIRNYEVIPIKDKEGDVQKLLCIVEDVTKSEEISDALIGAEVRYRSIINEIPVCIKLLNTKGDLIEINKYGKYEHYLEGKSDKEIKKWDYVSCTSDKDAPKIKKAIEDAVKGRISSFDVTHAPGKSRHKVCFLRVAPVDIAGELHVLISSYNITSSKQIEEDLKRKEARFKEAERIASIGGFEWDIKRDSATVSGELLNMLGVKQDYFYEKPLDKFLDLIHPDDKKIVQRRFEKRLQDKKPFEYESRIVRPNGDVRILHSKIEIINGGEDKNPTKLIGILQDITDRKQTEIKLEEKVDELERLNKHMIGRELKMKELKEEVSRLKESLEECISEKK